MQACDSGNKDHSTRFWFFFFFKPQLEHLSIHSKPSSVFQALLLCVVPESCREDSILLDKEGELSLFYSFLVK